MTSQMDVSDFRKKVAKLALPVTVTRYGKPVFIAVAPEKPEPVEEWEALAEVAHDTSRAEAGPVDPAQTLRMLRQWKSHAEPANALGQVSFSRAMLDSATDALDAAIGALETFAIMANEDTAHLPDEHVISLTYDDSALDAELGGPNTLLGQRFMRAFRAAASMVRPADVGSDA